MKMEKLDHKNLSDKVYEILKERIIRWELRPGERIKDRQIAETLGVSRSLVRNVLTLLEVEGYVTISRSGVNVAQFSQKQIQEIYAIRRLLEPFALELAFGNISPEELEDVGEKIRRAKQEIREDRFEATYELDVTLHHLIINKCSNSQVGRVYSNLQNFFGIATLLTNLRQRLQQDKRIDGGQMNYAKESLDEHARIYGAMKKRNLKEARDALIFHLTRAEDRAREYLELASSNQSLRSGADS